MAWAGLVLGGAALIALGARLSIPLPLVPITFQSFAVVLLGALLGSRGGAAAALAYLAAGAIGLPVFANGVAGPAALVGPTAGYLWMFAPAAWLVGTLAERGWTRRFGCTVLAMLCGEALLLTVGALWLLVLTQDVRTAMVGGMLIFLPGAVVKAAAAAIALPAAWRLITPR